MPIIDDATLHRSALFKVFWETNDSDLSNHGLNELTPEGARKLREFALRHESDGSVAEGRDPFGLIRDPAKDLISVSAGNEIRPAPGEKAR